MYGAWSTDNEGYGNYYKIAVKNIVVFFERCVSKNIFRYYYYHAQ